MKKIIPISLMTFGVLLWIMIGLSLGTRSSQSETSLVTSESDQQGSTATQGFAKVLLNTVENLVMPTPTPVPKTVSKPTSKTTTKSKATSGIQTQTTTQPTASGLPKTIKIPKIGVSAPVEYVGLDGAGRMDVPKQWNSVAWYKLGFKVGDNGAAVMSGHLDTSSGAPAVFYRLGNLNAGDEIIVTDDKGVNHRFRVKSKQFFPWDQFPLETVFGSAGTPALNLITCGGTWDRSARNYSQRIVVYSELIR